MLETLEVACYDPPRRSSPASLRRALASAHQEVWAIGDQAVIIVWTRPRTWRIYGLHTHPAAQGKGLASRLLAFAQQRAREAGAVRMVLEADAADGHLVAWYEARGYVVKEHKPDFYGPGRHAVRMERVLGAR